MEPTDARALSAAVDEIRTDVSALRATLGELLAAIRTLDETTKDSAERVSAMIRRWGT